MQIQYLFEENNSDSSSFNDLPEIQSVPVEFIDLFSDINDEEWEEIFADGVIIP